MIPKTIHYCWFGKNPKSEEIKRCIGSWKKTCPEFTIKEWNEDNFDVQAFPFTKKMYEEEKWAFVADYARLYTLEQEGGFYLDTDMLLLQSLSPLTTYDCVLGEESDGVISAGMIASAPSHPYIQACKDFYDTSHKEIITIPRALTLIFETYKDKDSIKVFPPNTFYPFDVKHIHEYLGQDLGEGVYGVHLWHYSWGHPLNKFFKKIGLYSIGKKITEILGIKQLLKKLLGFI
jgi:hypothetical protein